MGGTSINRAAASTENRRQAAKHIQAYNSQLAAVRSDPNLSDQGKRREIAAAYTAAKQRLARLADDERLATASARDQLQRQLFDDGLNSTDPAAVVSRRDALDRADRISTVAEAQRMLDRAHVTQDHALASAVARTAVARANRAQPGWGELVRTYVATRPRAADALQQLADLDRDKAVDQLASQAAFGLSRPTELAGESDLSIANLAAQPVQAEPQSPFERSFGLVGGPETITE